MRGRAIKRSLAAYILVALAVVLLGMSCASSSRNITAKGTSTTTVTATKSIKFKATGPITFPESYPGIGGMTLPAGQTIDIELQPGQSVILKDKVEVTGETIIVGLVETGTAQQSSYENGRNGISGLETTGIWEPYPVVQIRFQGTVDPGSTYTWTVPDLFGEAEAVVFVTGQVSARGGSDVVVDDGAGGWTLNSRTLRSFQYHVTGPPALWQAPIETQYGTIQGSGTIESDGDMEYGFFGEPSDVSGSGSEDYEDDEGQLYEYGYDGAFPVQLIIGDGTAVGMTTVEGGFDTF